MEFGTAFKSAPRHPQDRRVKLRLRMSSRWAASGCLGLNRRSSMKWCQSLMSHPDRKAGRPQQGRLGQDVDARVGDDVEDDDRFFRLKNMDVEPPETGGKRLLGACDDPTL